METVTDRGTIKATWHLLSDINEKIQAAIALKSVHNAYSSIIDEAIENVLRKRNEMATGNLTPQDLFYVKVTRIHELVKVFSNVTDDYIQRDPSTSKISTMLIDINAIILTMLNDVAKFREAKRSLFEIPANKHNRYEYLPWTAASGKNGKSTIRFGRDGKIHFIFIARSS